MGVSAGPAFCGSRSSANAPYPTGFTSRRLARISKPEVERGVDPKGTNTMGTTASATAGTRAASTRVSSAIWRRLTSSCWAEGTLEGRAWLPLQAGPRPLGAGQRRGRPCPRREPSGAGGRLSGPDDRGRFLPGCSSGGVPAHWDDESSASAASSPWPVPADVSLTTRTPTASRRLREAAARLLEGETLSPALPHRLATVTCPAGRPRPAAATRTTRRPRTPGADRGGADRAGPERAGEGLLLRRGVRRPRQQAEFTCREWCRLGRIKATKKSSGRGKHQAWAVSHEEAFATRRRACSPHAPERMAPPHSAGPSFSRSSLPQPNTPAIACCLTSGTRWR